MPSTTTYTNATERNSCYDCTRTESVKVKDQKVQLECRRYNEYGLTIELMRTMEQTELSDKRLVDIVSVGVDDVEFSTESHFDFKPQSRGAGGLSKYSCGKDYQTPQLVRHRKKGFTELLYVQSKTCTKELISTELQGWAFPNDRYDDRKLPRTAYSDALIEAGRRTLSKAANYNDIIGVFGGSNIWASAYDGILAQAYWAYTRNAFFQSVKFTIDETELINTYYLHAKYAGSALDIQYDSTQASDPTVERYETLEEVYDRLVEWLNNDIKDEGGRKYVDATHYLNDIYVTSKYTALDVELLLHVSNKATVNWLDCDVVTGVSYEILQGSMAIDERPYLVRFRRYTPENILKFLPEDIFSATNNMDMNVLMRGQTMALYIDERVWNMYAFARSQRTSNDPQGDLVERFGTNIYTLSALSQGSGTGLWFITAIEQDGFPSSLRNVKHLVDSVSAASSAPFVDTNNRCDQVEFDYEQLHGVLVKDFRLFASNLLCSPFADNLKEPHESTTALLPCYNPQVRRNFNNPNDVANCNINACFKMVSKFLNQARYALPNPAPAGGYNEFVLEDGQTLPNGALPIYEFHFQDCTTGIPLDLVPSAVYEYKVTFSDGSTPLIYTGKNLIISYVGNADGIAFNVTQTVTAGGCIDTYDASTSYPENYPFVMTGACADVNPTFKGRIDLIAYAVTGTNQFDTAISVTGAPSPIDLSGNPDGTDAEEAANIINAYFLANSIAGQAVGSGLNLVVYSPNVVFVNLDPLGTPVAFTKNYQITVVDQTDYDAFDGVESADVSVYCQTQPAPVTPTFAELPVGQDVNSCSAFAGWEVELTLVTKMGCTFNLAATVDSADVANNFVNFDLV